MKKSSEKDTQKLDPGTPPSTPRWVKVVGVMGGILVVAFIILHVTGHSPFMHMPMGGSNP